MMLARVIFSICLVALSALPASAAELLMFTRADCPFCVKWEREVGPVYPKTDENRIAPVRRVRTDRPIPNDALVQPMPRYTPTFVLVEDGREIGRFEGYMDDATFWGNLTMLLRRLDDRTPADAPAPTTKTSFEPR